MQLEAHLIGLHREQPEHQAWNRWKQPSCTEARREGGKDRLRAAF